MKLKLSEITFYPQGDLEYFKPQISPEYYTWEKVWIPLFKDSRSNLNYREVDLLTEVYQSVFPYEIANGLLILISPEKIYFYSDIFADSYRMSGINEENLSRKILFKGRLAFVKQYLSIGIDSLEEDNSVEVLCQAAFLDPTKLKMMT